MGKGSNSEMKPFTLTCNLPQFQVRKYTHTLLLEIKLKHPKLEHPDNINLKGLLESYLEQFNVASNLFISKYQDEFLATFLLSPIHSMEEVLNIIDKENVKVHQIPELLFAVTDIVGESSVESTLFFTEILKNDILDEGNFGVLDYIIPDHLQTTQIPLNSKVNEILIPVRPIA